MITWVYTDFVSGNERTLTVYAGKRPREEKETEYSLW